MTIRRELIDELLKDYETPQDILGEDGLLKELTKVVIERCLETEFVVFVHLPSSYMARRLVSIEPLFQLEAGQTITCFLYKLLT